MLIQFFALTSILSIQCQISFSRVSDQKVIDGYRLKWKHLETDFTAKYGFTLVSGSKRSVKQIGKGEGFTSKVYLINFDWQHQAKDLPSQCVMKIMSVKDVEHLLTTNEARKKAFSSYEYAAAVHDRELFFYGNVSKLVDSGLKIPKFYTGRAFDSREGWGYLTIEYLEGSVVKKLYETFSDGEIFEGIQQLALLNGLSLRLNDQFKQFVDDRDLIDVYASTNYLDDLRARTFQFPSKMDLFNYQFDVLKTFQNKANFLRKNEKNCPIKMVTHGDYWPLNFFWNFNRNGQPHLRAIADFANVHFGNPLYDLGKFLFFVSNANDYSFKREVYARFYFDTLKRAADGKRLPWSSYGEFLRQFEIEEVWKTVKLGWVVESFRLASRTAPFSQQERQKIMKMFLEKYFAMLEEGKRLFNKWEKDIL